MSDGGGGGLGANGGWSDPASDGDDGAGAGATTVGVDDGG